MARLRDDAEVIAILMAGPQGCATKEIAQREADSLERENARALSIAVSRYDRANDELSDHPTRERADDLEHILAGLDMQIARNVSCGHPMTPAFAKIVANEYMNLVKIQRTRGNVNPSRSDFAPPDEFIFSAAALAAIPTDVRERMRAIIN